MYKQFTMELAGRTLRVDVGRVGAQANGCAFMHYGDTTVLSTATASEKPNQLLHSGLSPVAAKYISAKADSAWSRSLMSCSSIFSSSAMRLPPSEITSASRSAEAWSVPGLRFHGMPSRFRVRPAVTEVHRRWGIPRPHYSSHADESSSMRFYQEEKAVCPAAADGAPHHEHYR